MEVVEYLIVMKTRREELEEKVNLMLSYNEGWRPQGGIFKDKNMGLDVYYQAMIKVK
jgi:hypothetical protein